MVRFSNKMFADLTENVFWCVFLLLFDFTKRDFFHLFKSIQVYRSHSKSTSKMFSKSSRRNLTAKFDVNWNDRTQIHSHDSYETGMRTLGMSKLLHRVLLNKIFISLISKMFGPFLNVYLLFSAISLCEWLS